MNDNQDLPTGDRGPLRRAEKAISVSPEEFSKMQAADVQRLVADLVREALDLETQARQLREIHEKLEISYVLAHSK